MTDQEDPRDKLFELSNDGPSIGRRAGGASIFVLLMSFCKVVLQIGSIAVLARLIPPEEYAIFVLALPGVALAMALSNFGLPQAIIQKKTINHAQVSTLFWANAALAVIAMLVVMGLSFPAAGWFDEPKVTPVIQVIALSVLISAMSAQYIAIMRRTLRVRTVEITTFIAEVCGVALSVVLALWGWSYWALVLRQIASPLINLTLLMIITQWRPSGPGKANLRDARDSLAFGGFVAGSSILTRLSQYIGTVIIGATLGPTPTALFYRSTNLAMIPQRRVMMPLSSVFTPTLSRLQDDPPAQIAMFGRFVSRTNLLLMPAAVGIATGAPWVVALLLGPDWEGVTPLLFWASLFTFGSGLRGALQNLFFACGESRPFFGISVLRFVLVALALYAMAPHGLEAMVAGYMLTELLLLLPITVIAAGWFTPVTWRTVLHYTGFDIAFALALAAGLFVLIVPLLEGWSALPALFVLGVCIGGAYGIRVLLTPELRQEALRVLGRLLRGTRGDRSR